MRPIAQEKTRKLPRCLHCRKLGIDVRLKGHHCPYKKEDPYEEFKKAPHKKHNKQQVPFNKCVSQPEKDQIPGSNTIRMTSPGTYRLPVKTIRRQSVQECQVKYQNRMNTPDLQINSVDTDVNNHRKVLLQESQAETRMNTPDASQHSINSEADNQVLFHACQTIRNTESPSIQLQSQSSYTPAIPYRSYSQTAAGFQVEYQNRMNTPDFQLNSINTDVDNCRKELFQECQVEARMNTPDTPQYSINLEVGNQVLFHACQTIQNTEDPSIQHQSMGYTPAIPYQSYSQTADLIYTSCMMTNQINSEAVNTQSYLPRLEDILDDTTFDEMFPVDLFRW